MAYVEEVNETGDAAARVEHELVRFEETMVMLLQKDHTAGTTKY